jgi:hypothetical protein
MASGAAGVDIRCCRAAWQRRAEQEVRKSQEICVGCCCKGYVLGGPRLSYTLWATPHLPL